VGKGVYSRSGRNLPPHRPRRIFDREQVVALRRQGLPLRQIAKKLGLGWARSRGRYSSVPKHRSRSVEQVRRNREVPIGVLSGNAFRPLIESVGSPARNATRPRLGLTRV
jgi:hypothetical protein